MIDQQEFARRRRQLMRTVGEGAMVLVPSAPVRLRNGDVEYPFRQSSDFQYLSGFPEPEALLVLAPGNSEGSSVLFCRERDAKREQWDGSMVGLKGAVADFGMDKAYAIEDVDRVLPKLMDGHERLYYGLGRDRDFDQQVMSWIGSARARNGARAPEEFISLDHHIHDMRLYKSRKEVTSMTRAARIAADAHRVAMQTCHPGMMEYELRAELLKVFHANNAEASYQPIVGGGANACVMHYITCQDALNDGDLVLIDAGAEFDYYASDITRTFPVNGRFTPEQRAVYDVVLAGQEAAIAASQPGAGWDAPHTAAVRAITRGLIDIGLLKGRIDTLMRKKAYLRFFMHKTGHWLGMDVHDVGEYQIEGQARELEAGMAMTVEPGVYIDGKRDIPKAFRHIGIRIEDSVVLTRNGPKVLSSSVPKAADEIENLMA